jgi:hypothetical protein
MLKLYPDWERANALAEVDEEIGRRKAERGPS